MSDPLREAAPVATICRHCYALQRDHLIGYRVDSGQYYYCDPPRGEPLTEWDPMEVYAAAPSPVRERWTVDREYGPNDIAIVVDGDSDYCIAFMACDRPEHRAFAERVCDAHNATVTLSDDPDALRRDLFDAEFCGWRKMPGSDPYDRVVKFFVARGWRKITEGGSDD